MLHSGEVQDEGNAGDEDEIEKAHRGEEMSSLAQIGTAEEHLKQHLSGTNKAYQKERSLNVIKDLLGIVIFSCTHLVESRSGGGADC